VYFVWAIAGSPALDRFVRLKLGFVRSGMLSLLFSGDAMLALSSKYIRFTRAANIRRDGDAEGEAVAPALKVGCLTWHGAFVGRARM
jgi:hypothetical protein